MRSIRLSLAVYFVLLLAAALGAVSAFVYETASSSLQDKKRATLQLLDSQYEERCLAEEEKVYKALLADARTLARLARYHIDYNRIQLRQAQTTVFTFLAASPVASPLTPANLALVVQVGSPEQASPLVQHVYRGLNIGVELVFNEEDLRHTEGDQVTEYYQVNGDWGKRWKSRSLGELWLPFNRQVYYATEMYEFKRDRVALEPGREVLRLRFKAPIVQRFTVGGQPNRPPPERRPRSDALTKGRPPEGASGARRGPDHHGGTPSPSRGPFVPAILIQCAADAGPLEETLAKLRAERDQEKAEVEATAAATLDGLQRRLFLVSALTFAAAVVGGSWLLRLGLAPLHRLSEAVSRVTEKDIRLQFDGRKIPRELKPIAERVTQTLDLLKRAFAREKQAAADISHELRTPLAALLTTIDVALRKPRSAEEYREILADCRASGQQINQLVERLLALARLDAGVDTLRCRDVDVAALADQCASLVRPLAEARNLTLSVQPADGPVHLQADPNKLREVVTNLLHNAIEYNRPQGTVDLSVRRENGHLHIEVRDTGIGIPPEAREHIFERFFRADPSRSADGLHAGLGLAIVKGYVDLMRGSITVDSAVGQGSSFRVCLPVS